MTTRPVIGLTADYDESGERPFHRLLAEYTAAVKAAGGVPLLIPSLCDADQAVTAMASLDGVILTGGRDLSPASYGEKRLHEKTKPVPHEREASNMAVAGAALGAGIPVLCICMGCQLLNVVCGGTLVQDIPSQWENPLPHGAAGKRRHVFHDVRVKDGSRLRGIVGADSLEVNSSHHQAVLALGRGLDVVARADDEVVEAVEMPGRWVIGVQWHPERITDRPQHIALFTALVEAAAAD